MRQSGFFGFAEIAGHIVQGFPGAGGSGEQAQPGHCSKRQRARWHRSPASNESAPALAARVTVVSPAWSRDSPHRRGSACGSRGSRDDDYRTSARLAAVTRGPGIARATRRSSGAGGAGRSGRSGRTRRACWPGDGYHGCRCHDSRSLARADTEGEYYRGKCYRIVHENSS